jgi:hypothetical protein
MEAAVNQARSELDDIRSFRNKISINPGDLKKIHPNLLHYDEANKLVEVPILDPLAHISPDEIGVIAQLSILERCFTVDIPVNAHGVFDEEYRIPENVTLVLDKSIRVDGNRLWKTIGGLPGTMRGVDRFINLTPAIDGERAELFASAIKPMLPNRIEPEGPQEQPGLLSRIGSGIKNLMGMGSNDD